MKITEVESGQLEGVSAERLCFFGNFDAELYSLKTKKPGVTLKA